MVNISMATEESAETLTSRFSGLPLSEQTMASLPMGREQEVLNALIKDRAVYTEVLLRLNHGPTIDWIVGGFKARDGKASAGRRTIESSGSPYIIDELAPQLYKTDQIKARQYDESGFDYGESAQAAEMIGQLIIRAPEFPAASKEWAKQNLGGPGPNIIQAARAWWELNQAALLANQFDQVRVPEKLRQSPPPETVVTPAIEPAFSSGVIEPAETPSVEPAPASTPPPITPAPDPEPPAPAKSSRPPFWLWCAAVIALVAALFTLRRKTSKR